VSLACSEARVTKMTLSVIPSSLVVGDPSPDWKGKVQSLSAAATLLGVSCLLARTVTVASMRYFISGVLTPSIMVVELTSLTTSLMLYALVLVAVTFSVPICLMCCRLVGCTVIYSSTLKRKCQQGCGYSVAVSPDFRVASRAASFSAL